MVGQVNEFGKRGFGFILAEDGSEYFAHQSDILMDGFRCLNKGDKVEFDKAVNEKNGKSKAVNIKKIG